MTTSSKTAAIIGIDNIFDDNEKGSFDYSDEEDGFERMESATKKKKKIGIEPNPSSADTDTARGIDDKRRGNNYADSSSSDNYATMFRSMKIDLRDIKWEKMYQQLVAYKKVHGDCKIPQKDPKFGKWAKHQRTLYRNNTIQEERKFLLNSIGFPWGALPRTSIRNRAPWEDMFQRLIAYKTLHRDCKVPQQYNEDLQLGAWVNNQRSAYKRNDISEERKRLLNSIGFELNGMRPGTANRVVWEEMYLRLVAYNTAHNDANVPRHYDVDPQLGNWVATQRYREKTMTEERKQLLNSIDFVWEGVDKIRGPIYNKRVLGA